MNEIINNLRLDAGIAQLKDDPRLVVIDIEGNVIDPLVGLEKFAELIVLECAKCMTTPQIQAKWPDDAVMKTVLDVLVGDMKEHFGVE